MKTNKLEKQIVSLIKLRQLELSTEALETATKPMPKTTKAAMKRLGKIMGLTFRVAQLQRAKLIIEPKQTMPLGGRVHGKEEIILPDGKKIEPPTCKMEMKGKIQGYYTKT